MREYSTNRVLQLLVPAENWLPFPESGELYSVHCTFLPSATGKKECTLRIFYDAFSVNEVYFTVLLYIAFEVQWCCMYSMNASEPPAC